MNLNQCNRGSDSFPEPAVRVLLVEDSDLIREAVGRLLPCCCSGLEIVAMAGDGLHALQAARLHRPDLVLMDVEMPQMNGVEAASRMRNEFPAIRVILFSTHDDAEYRRVAEESGAAFIPKLHLLERFRDLFLGLFPHARGQNVKPSLPD